MKHIVLFAFLAAASFSWAEDAPPSVTIDDPAEVLSLNDVPQKVRQAARASKPDVFFTSAESMWIDDHHIYRLSGTLFREAWDIYVRSDGVVTRMESNYLDD